MRPNKNCLIADIISDIVSIVSVFRGVFTIGLGNHVNIALWIMLNEIKANHENLPFLGMNYEHDDGFVTG